jgi:hypothetical protein
MNGNNENGGNNGSGNNKTVTIIVDGAPHEVEKEKISYAGGRLRGSAA